MKKLTLRYIRQEASGTPFKLCDHIVSINGRDTKADHRLAAVIKKHGPLRLVVSPEKFRGATAIQVKRGHFSVKSRRVWVCNKWLNKLGLEWVDRGFNISGTLWVKGL